MKGRNLILTAGLVMAAGIVLIITHNSIRSTGVVVTGGILFVIAGLINVLLFEGERKRGRWDRGALSSTFSWLTSVAAVILGICMLVFQGTFITLVPMMFGILVAFSALYQFYILAIGSRPTLLPGWFYIVPVALIGGAAFIFMQDSYSNDPKIMLATGISLTAFGVAGLAESAMLSHYRRHPKAIPMDVTADTANEAAETPATAQTDITGAMQTNGVSPEKSA